MIDWLNDNSGAVQAASVAALAIITAVYAWRTWSISSATAKQAEASAKMAEATRDQAHASVRMVEEMREQRLSMSQPVVVPKPLEVHNVKDQHNIRLTLTNVGNGPAISLRRTVSHPSLKVASGSTKHSQKWPILLMDEEQDMSFVLGHPVDAADAQLEISWKDIHDQQFTLTAPMKWKESGQMELGDMDFRVVKGDG